MSSLSRMFGSLAAKELMDISREARKNPIFAHTVTKASREVVGQVCQEVIDTKPSDLPNTLAAVDTAIVALTHYRDLIDPEPYLTDQETKQLVDSETGPDVRIYMLNQFSDRLMEKSNQRQARLANSQQPYAARLKTAILADLDTKMHAELVEELGPELADVIIKA